MIENKKWIQVVRWIVRIWTLVPVLFLFGEIIFPHSGSAEMEWYEWFSLGLLGLIVLSLLIAWKFETLGGGVALILFIILVIVFINTVDNYFPAIVIFLLALGLPAVAFVFLSKIDQN